ncbi:hypothetical protein AU197_01890 [Mycobacterium sp. IS-1590]|uniref:MPT63 family protein n=1 Tax=Mycobacterium sp. IS-1590 TaxID=1772286 RepID=UPI000746FA61|nr:DUF1942 domain-containing protein [Mycobacterium sp. IS-1590]KUI41309.1 hypothetical protein AU197_01890 [Mycobacterium sp. IS-1590]
MKISKISSIVAATATAGFIAAPLASAEPEATPPGPVVQTQTLGTQGKLVDGAVIQGWTITNLKPSSDVIPYPVTGTLWEATATDQAIQGSVTPIVANLVARTADGQTYRSLFEVATPQGVNPSTLAQGQETSGKVYFDVTGATPDSVAYSAGGQDLLVWTQPATSSATSSSSPSTSYGTGSTAPAEAPATEAAPEGTTAAPAATGTEAPEGSQGTPIAEGSQGTPIAEGTPAPAAQGTPAQPEGVPAPAAQGVPAQPEGVPAPTAQGVPAQPAQGTPAPAGAEGVPQPAGSQGTPLPAGDQVQIPTTYTPAPTP